MAVHPNEHRALVSLQALCVGDAFGERYFGLDAARRVRERRLAKAPWKWTDDTAMAVSVLETLIAHGSIDQDDLARRFAARYALEPVRGYGPASHIVLGDIKIGVPWRTAAGALFDGTGSYGNGAAMRAPVIGAWYADDIVQAARQAHLSAQVTHAHKEGIAGAVAVAVAAALTWNSADLPHGSAFVSAVAERTPRSKVRDGLRAATQLPAGATVEHAAGLLGNGTDVSAQDTVPLAVWCASLHLHDYETAMWETVSALGDRDTTCAIVGGIIAGAIPAGSLPADWVEFTEPLPVIAGSGR